MNANLKPALPRPVDEWKEFRPEEFTRRSSSGVVLKLLVLVFLVAVLLLSWIFFKPSIGGTVAKIQKAISGLRPSPVASSHKRSVAAERTHRESRSIRAQRVEQPTNSAAALRPFEVYLLDGDRYIRVDASDRSVLLNTRTGETTWVDSDSMAEDRR